MHNQPSIYLDFYSRYVTNGTSVARMGGGGLDDVLRYIARPGISVVSSFHSIPDGLIITMGRALVDPKLGLVPVQLPPLDANGGPFWLFWEANDLTANAAALMRAHWKHPTGKGVLWVRMKGRAATGLVNEHDIVANLEESWIEAWPSGSVYVRFEGDSEDLEHWMRPCMEANPDE